MGEPASAGKAEFEHFRVRLVESLPRLRGFAVAYCGSRADADDAIQVTCERALKRWQQWSGEGALEHWLMRILINAWRDELRSRRVRAGPSFDSVELADGREEGAASSVYLEQVRGRIMQLPDGQREVLLLVAGEGFSYRETAEALDIPLGTVMSRLSRARQALITALGEDGA